MDVNYHFILLRTKTDSQGETETWRRRVLLRKDYALAFLTSLFNTLCIVITMESIPIIFYYNSN